MQKTKGKIEQIPSHIDLDDADSPLGLGMKSQNCRALFNRQSSIVNRQFPDPLTRPAPADKSAGCGPPSPPRGRGLGALSSLLPFAFCLLSFAFALFLLPGVLHAQGCAMCYNSASAARSSAKEALANGVLILLVPPMVFFALITVVVYMYRNKFREPATWRPEHDRELQELLADLAPANGIQQIGRSDDPMIGKSGGRVIG